MPTDSPTSVTPPELVLMPSARDFRAHVKFDPSAFFFYFRNLFRSVSFKSFADKNVPELEVEMLVGGAVYFMVCMNDDVHDGRNLLIILTLPINPG